MEITCYIVDDEHHAVDTLKDYVESLTNWRLLGTSLSALQAAKEITELAPDVTFMDVDMPQLSGLDLTELVGDKTMIIFTSAFSDYAVNAYEKGVSDFLLKPISTQRFIKAAKKAEATFTELGEAKRGEAREDYFFINPGIRGQMLKLNYDDILYIEGLRNYVTLFTKDKKHITYLKMAEVERALPKQFFRIHKSFIVNAPHIKAVDGQYITLDNGDKLTLGPLYKETLISYIAKYSLLTDRK